MGLPTQTGVFNSLCPYRWTELSSWAQETSHSRRLGNLEHHRLTASTPIDRTP
jgi:hypothetical protein